MLFSSFPPRNRFNSFYVYETQLGAQQNLNRALWLIFLSGRQPSRRGSMSGCATFFVTAYRTRPVHSVNCNVRLFVASQTKSKYRKYLAVVNSFARQCLRGCEPARTHYSYVSVSFSQRQKTASRTHKGTSWGDTLTSSLPCFCFFLIEFVFKTNIPFYNIVNLKVTFGGIKQRR